MRIALPIPFLVVASLTVSVSAADDAPSLDATISYVVEHTDGSTVAEEQACEAACPTCGPEFHVISVEYKVHRSEDGSALEIEQPASERWESSDFPDHGYKGPDGKRWPVKFERWTDNFSIPLRLIAIDRVDVKRDTPDYTRCKYTSSPPYDVNIHLQKKVHVREVYVLYYRNGDRQIVGDDEESIQEDDDSFTFTVPDSDTAMRLRKAIIHAATLAGAQKDPF